MALTAGAAGAVLFALAGTAEAVTIQAAKTVKAGQTTTVTVVAPGADHCMLTVPGQHSRPAFLGNGTKVAFVFRIAKNARGAYKVSATCDTTTVNTRIKVKNRRKRGSRALNLAYGLIKGSSVDATDEDAATPAETPITADSPEVDAFYQRWFANMTGGGGCQGWIFRKRPDIVEKLERTKLAQWIAAGKPGDYDIAFGNPNSWVGLAPAAGLTVSNTPTVGSVVVWPRTHRTPNGHVGYVESVAADGSFSTSDMNINGVPYSMGYYSFAPADIARYGLLFIS
jgi:hypothetical protein